MARNYEKFMKQGDTGEPVRACVRNESDGSAPDWSGATVRFKMWQLDETGSFVVLVDAPASVELPADSSGTLRYDWQAGDSDTVGRHPAAFEVDDGTTVETYPREGFMWINIEQKG